MTARVCFVQTLYECFRNHRVTSNPTTHPSDDDQLVRIFLQKLRKPHVRRLCTKQIDFKVLTETSKRYFVCVLSNPLILQNSQRKPLRINLSDMVKEDRGMHNIDWLCDTRHTTCDVSSGAGSILVYWPSQRRADGADRFVHLT